MFGALGGSKLNCQLSLPFELGCRVSGLGFRALRNMHSMHYCSGSAAYYSEGTSAQVSPGPPTTLR